MRFSINKAREAFQSRDFELSLLNYMAVLRTLPMSKKLEYLEEILDTFARFLILKRPDNQTRDILMVLCDLYGDDVLYLKSMAEWLAAKDEHFSSSRVFRRAIELVNNSKCRCSTDELIMLKVNFEHSNSFLFDAWHWQMVNSKSRNEAFGNAICKAIEQHPNSFLLDLGCGSGILSVIAARTRKTKKIVACDYSETMCSICSEVANSNDMDSLAPFELQQMHSADLKLFEKADILVTETVDSAIFGESIIPTLIDAYERLIKCDAIAIMYLMALESVDIASRSFCEIGDYSILSLNCFSQHHAESKLNSGYTCAHLDELAHDYRTLSEPLEAISIDFNDRAQVKSLGSGDYHTNLKLRINKKGTINGFVSWFKLNTFEDISVGSYPGSGSSWQQAIWPCYPPLLVEDGDEIEIAMVLKKGDQLRVIPTSHSKIGDKQLLRVDASNRFDFPALNDTRLRDFLLRSVSLRRKILDTTDVCLFRYLDSADRTVKVKTSNKIVQTLATNDQIALEDFIPDTIVFWPISSRGWISDEKVMELIELQSGLSNADVIPAEITLKSYLFSSDLLVSRSRLTPGRQLDVNLTPMDKFKSSWLYDISPQKTSHRKMSGIHELFKISFNNPTEILSNLSLTRVPTKFRAELSGEAHGLLCWYQVSYEGLNLELNDENFQVSTFLFDTPLNIIEGSEVTVLTSIFHNSFVFEVE